MVTPKDYKLRVQGDRWTFTETMPAGCFAFNTSFWMQLKQSRDSPDPGYGISHNNVTAIAVTDTSAIFTFAEAITSAIASRSIWYEIKMSTLARGVETVYEGQIEVLPWASETPALPTFVVVAGETEFSFETEVAFTVPPIAAAGPDAAYDRYTGSPYTLAGSGTGTGPLTYAWTQVSGPGTAVFADATSPTTTVTFSANGAVVLRLTVTNASGSRSDDVTITVSATLGGLFGSALKGEYHSDLGYNGSTHAWNDQTANANHLTVTGTPTVNAGALNGYPSITYATAAAYHKRTSFTGLPTGTKVTCIAVHKQDATAGVRGFWGVPGRRGGYHAPTFNLTSADFNTSQTNAADFLGIVDTRTDRFHIWADSGELAPYYDGRSCSPPPAVYTGISGAATEVRLGVMPELGLGLRGDVVSFLVIAGALTRAQLEAVCSFYDDKYGLNTMTSSKWLAVLGQSNARLLTTRWGVAASFVRPRNSRMYANATDGTTLVASPFDWGPTDPHGWRAATAADYLASASVGGIARPAIIWSQGESDLANSSYTAGVLALIADMDTRMGRSDTPWIIPRIHPSSSAAAQRPFQDAIAAALPARVKIVNTDDLSLVDAQHYTNASHDTVYLRCLAAIDTYWGSTDWAG